MTAYDAQNIVRINSNRLTGKKIDMSGWHVIKNGEWLHGPMTETLAKKMASAYMADDKATLDDCYDIIQHGRVLTETERKSLYADAY